jgi:cysteine desulfurase
MLKVMTGCYGNPSSVHTLGREAKVLVEDSRKTVAGFFNVTPSEIYFTATGTEAIVTAMTGAIRDLDVRTIITSGVEHHAVLHTAEALKENVHIQLKFVKTDSKGRVDLYDLENLLESNDNCLVALMHANNEIGTILPLEEVAELCEKYKAYFFCDTVQTIGKYKLNLRNIRIHFAACSAHKFHGPKGAGFLYINSDVRINPLLNGGGQERNMRSGTENLYGIAGLAKALEVAYNKLEEKEAHISELRRYMIERLKAEIPGILFNGDVERNCLYNLVNVSFPLTKNSDMLLQKLDIAGIEVSGGSACSSGATTASHVLKAIGANTEMIPVRFSFSKFNKKDEVDTCVDILKSYLI